MKLSDNDVEHYNLEYVGLSREHPLRMCTTDVGKHITGGDERYRADGSTLPHLAPSMDCLEVRGYTSGGICPLHQHEFYEIALVRRGTMTHVRTGGEAVDVKRGQVVVATPSARHGWRDFYDVSYTDLYLLPLWLLEDLRVLWDAGGLVNFLLAHALFDLEVNEGLLMFETSEEETVLWEHEVTALEQEFRRETPSIIQINGCFLKILDVLNNAYMRSSSYIEMPINHDVWRCAAFIEELICRGKPFESDEMASELGMSSRHLRRLFREATGTTPTAYYNNRRLEHACSRLSDPDVSIKQVASHLGFADVAHFSRRFKAHTGVSPRAYKAKHAQGDTK